MKKIALAIACVGLMLAGIGMAAPKSAEAGGISISFGSFGRGHSHSRGGFYNRGWDRGFNRGFISPGYRSHYYHRPSISPFRNRGHMHHHHGHHHGHGRGHGHGGHGHGGHGHGGHGHGGHGHGGHRH